MGQAEVIKILKRTKKPLTSIEISKLAGISSASDSLKKLKYYGEVEWFEDYELRRAKNNSIYKIKAIFYYLKECEKKIDFSKHRKDYKKKLCSGWLSAENLDIVLESNGKRPTSKSKQKTNKGFPYKRGGHRR